MNYKVNDHSYNNTGGNCMVSTFQIYDIDNNRTLFVHVNEEGGTLATCDYINNDIDYDDAMTIDNFNKDDLTKDNENFELYRYCMIEYTKKDCKYFGNTASLPYDLLTDELQQQLTPHYRAWYEENIGGDYETDGYEVKIDSSYVPPVKQHHMKPAVYEAIKEFRAAWFKLDEVFDDGHYMTWLSDKYPFEYSFDELLHEVANWCDDMVEGVIVD